MKTTLKLISLLAIIAVVAFGQTAVTTTTISAAMTVGQNTVTLASATSVSVQAGAGNEVITGLFIDKEFMRVLSLVSGTTYNVQRAQESTRQLPHASGATVYVGPLRNGPFVPARPESSEVKGSCSLVTEPYTFRVYLVSGNRYSCMGLTTAQQWVNVTGAGVPVLGATVASAASAITASGTLLVVSGTAAITGITAVPGAGPGFTIRVIPSGAFTWTTAGNIALAGTAVVNRVLEFVWSGTAWIPSYV